MAFFDPILAKSCKILTLVWLSGFFDLATLVQVGDRVAPSTNMAGTWSTHSELREGNFVIVDKAVTLESAATLFINPCTAYLMLRHGWQMPIARFLDCMRLALRA